MSSTVAQAVEAVSVRGLSVEVRGRVVTVRGPSHLRAVAMEQAHRAAVTHGWKQDSVILAFPGAGQ